jgi:hypothetical protein
MIPLYGFLDGDTVGLVILGDEVETVASLAEKIMASARTRVAPFDRFHVLYRGNRLALKQTLVRAGIEALERIDVVRDRGGGE